MHLGYTPWFVNVATGAAPPPLLSDAAPPPMPPRSPVLVSDRYGYWNDSPHLPMYHLPVSEGSDGYRCPEQARFAQWCRLGEAAEAGCGTHQRSPPVLTAAVDVFALGTIMFEVGRCAAGC